MKEADVDRWICALEVARRSAQRFDPSDAGPSTCAEAYRIQAHVADAFGPVAGFKTARKGAARPIMAPIFLQDVVASGGQAAVRDVLGIELEIGFRIQQDLPEDLLNASPTERQACLQPVTVLELVDTRVTGPRAEDALVKLADNQINAGLVVGDACDAWDGSDFGQVDAILQAGQDNVITKRATVPGGSALASVAALAGMIGTHCGGLKPGQIIITGSLHPLVYYPSGTYVCGSVAGIGTVDVSLVSPQE